jgi:hypothetical protein
MSLAGSGKSVVSLKDNYQSEFSGSSKGFALCARKQTRRDDTDKYTQKHAEESNQILNLLDGIKAKILASQNVWSKTTLPNAQKDVEVTTAALAKAQEQKDIADIELKKVNKDMEDAVRRNEREISMIEQIQAHIHSLNGRGADTCSGLPDGLHATKDDGAQIFCKEGMVRCVQKMCLWCRNELHRLTSVAASCRLSLLTSGMVTTVASLIATGSVQAPPSRLFPTSPTCSTTS